MSYNCDKWTTKRLENLSIPMPAFFTSDKKDWLPKFDRDGFKCRLTNFDSFALDGEIHDDNLYVKTIIIQGECSGTFINAVLEPALKESTGELEAVTIWEGGDSIQRLTVKDGNVKWEPIEL